MDLTQKIKSLIKSHGEDQADVAKAWKVSESTFSFWVNKPTLKFIFKLAEYYNLEPWELLAPENVLLPNMTKLQKEIMQVYTELPEELRKSILDNAIIILKAYLFGKSHQSK